MHMYACDPIFVRLIRMLDFGSPPRARTGSRPFRCLQPSRTDRTLTWAIIGRVAMLVARSESVLESDVVTATYLVRLVFVRDDG